MMFRDRTDAGRQLGAALLARRVGGAVVVLGLPDGGVPVAAEVARALHAPLDVVVARKVGVPHQPGLAMGAVAEGGVVVVDERVTAAAGVDPEEVSLLARHEEAEVERQVHRYVGERVRPSLAGRTAVVVDDGVATGATARAACAVARAWGASRVVLAVPVGPPAAGTALGDAADEFVCLHELVPFLAVGQAYTDFLPPTEDGVLAALHPGAFHRRPVGVAADGATASGTMAEGAADDGAAAAAVADLPVATGGAVVAGVLAVPPAPVGIAVFAHSSGDSRFSPANRWMAARCHRAGLASLLMDLLEPQEAVDREHVFDIALLAERLAAALHRLDDVPDAAGLPLGLVGTGTGAAAALVASTYPAADVRAVVCRGGRPDLVDPDVLERVEAPTLLLVGGRDELVAQLNRRAATHLGAEHRLVVVPGAGHRFSEPGALAEAADLAVDWLAAHLAAHHGAGGP